MARSSLSVFSFFDNFIDDFLTNTIRNHTSFVVFWQNVNEKGLDTNMSTKETHGNVKQRHGLRKRPS